MFNKSNKKIFGRWLEALGIGLITAGIVGFRAPNIDLVNFYWIGAGSIVAVCGALLT